MSGNNSEDEQEKIDLNNIENEMDTNHEETNRNVPKWLQLYNLVSLMTNVYRKKKRIWLKSKKWRNEKKNRARKK